MWHPVWNDAYAFAVTLRNHPLVEFLMAALAKGNEIIGSISAGFSALQMVDVKPDLFFLGCVCSATLTGVPVSPKHVLPYIVVTVHLTLLVVLALRDRFAFFNGLQQLEVELGGLYDHFAHG